MCKIMKELIINIYMLIKSVIKAGCRRLIVVILREIEKNYKMIICGLLIICYALLRIIIGNQTLTFKGIKK